jgi:hypothetical protein
MVTILYRTLNNEDLKRRILIMKNLDQLITFVEVKKLVRDPNTNTDVPMNVIEFEKKIDISCTLSLETWDNSRRIAVQIDKEKSAKYELSYVFLGIYFIFIFVLLTSIVFDLTIFVSKESVYLHEPILVMNMLVDFVLIGIMFVNRIYYID